MAGNCSSIVVTRAAKKRTDEEKIRYVVVPRAAVNALSVPQGLSKKARSTTLVITVACATKRQKRKAIVSFAHHYVAQDSIAKQKKCYLTILDKMITLSLSTMKLLKELDHEQRNDGRAGGSKRILW